MLSKDQRPSASRKLSWKSVYGGGSSSKDKEVQTPPLAPPQEGVELLSYVQGSFANSASSLPSPAPPPTTDDDDRPLQLVHLLPRLLATDHPTFLSSLYQPSTDKTTDRFNQ